MAKQDDKINISSTVQWSVFGVGLIIMVALMIYASMSGSDVQANVGELQNEVTQLSNELGVKRQEEQQVRNEVIHQTTGIHPQTVREDTQLAESFLRPAFTWTSGEEYDEIRDEYIQLLGSDSSFVNVYLAENLTVDDFNYIDVNELKSEFMGMDVYALEEREDKAMDYLGVVDYYLYKDEADLLGADQLTTSKAIVKFTVLGEGDMRDVSEVFADPGFVSN